ncbi:hypothetical protein DOTSEDRAFT_72094 [Dothistroma septosporum NZE10]|uniref:Acyl-CoA thioesterase-like C-terminal domain-containing protein n=1 Tax=Dothistroma septosporum (strain NZE10 / CBS 128990) TaxID=675120 RepID=N1PQ51_DOTSN|nr:hypothetical protein DOTSEDRAFT_72094 [Dothistroma septosporum NZE10]
MTAYNEDRHPLDRRQLIFYRTLGEMSADPNFHLCAHLYASDRNSLYIVSNHLDLGHTFTQMSSLVHTVVFHSPSEDLMFGPAAPLLSESSTPMDDLEGKWFCMEAWGSRVGSGRALYQCRIWDSQGRHSLTAMQDGLLRLVTGSEVTKESGRMLEDVKGRWKEKL